MVIILGTAHLKNIPGKSSPDGKFREYKYSREICKTIKDILEDMGYTVFIDVEKDDLKMKQSLELIHRCQIVNKLCKLYKDCIYISIHVNASGSDNKWHDATGWEIYTTKGTTKADKLATYIYKRAESNFKNAQKLRVDFSDGDPDKEAEFYVLKHTSCPAVLTENFFLDNKKDVEFLTSDVGFHQIVRLHVEGIIDYVKNVI